MVVLTFILGTILTSTLAQARALSVTSFNIKMFDSSEEERLSAIKNFLDEKVNSDVYVFEEILDKQAILRLMGKDFQCVSYDSSMKGHQYVVLCARTPLKLKIDTQTDDNFSLEAVAMGSSGQRPAVHALIHNEKGLPILRVFGVHLSAFPARTDTRIDQIKIIRDHLKKADQKIPTVITGDFNTYPSTLTGKPRSDVELITEILEKENGDMMFAPHPSLYTFRTPEFRSKFDHFWVSKSLRMKGPVKVSGWCNSSLEDNDEEVSEYYRLVSDHCPVTAQFDL